MLFLTLNIVIH